jgi:hypothetical protein
MLLPRGGPQSAEEPPVAKAGSLVGLDVHTTKVVAAVLDAETGELQLFALSGEIEQAAGLCAGLPRPVRAAYEAEPTGYALARELARHRHRTPIARSLLTTASPYRIEWTSGARTAVDPPFRDVPVVHPKVTWGFKPREGVIASGRRRIGPANFDWVEIAQSILLDDLLDKELAREEFSPLGSSDLSNDVIDAREPPLMR